MVENDLLSVPVFNSLGQKVIINHLEFFKSFNPPALELNHEEIKKLYGERFIKGWRISVITYAKSSIDLDVLLDYEIPFSIPRIALVDRNYFLEWPHIEKNGFLCLRNSNDFIIHSTNTDLTKYLIDEAVALINKCISGNNKEDFINEFESYWIYLGNTKNPSDILLLVEDVSISKLVYYTTVKDKILICESIDEGCKWISDYTGNNYTEIESFKTTAIFRLSLPLFPDQYPLNNKKFSEIIDKTDLNILRSIVPSEIANTPVIIAFQTINGPAIGCTWLNEPMEYNAMKHKSISRRFDGFKNKKNAPPEKYFLTNEKTDFSSVSRLNKNWLIERGGKGFNSKIINSKVCIIGCGALGSVIARLLSQAGIGNINLIDDESLEWNNIGRHLLGAEFVGKKKTDALKCYLQGQLPGAININSYPQKWQSAFKENSSVLVNNDLIISTTGDWDSESALNYLFNKNAYIPPVIYGWFEPFGICGHALLITKFGGCFSCGMNDYGKFMFPVTSWDQVDTLKREPACSSMYQPYGITDILPIQAMLTNMALDFLMNKIRYSEHHTWVGNTDLLQELKGELSTHVQSYYSDFKKLSILKKSWKINKKCYYKH